MDVTYPNIFFYKIGDTETGYFSATPEINIGITISLVLCIRSKRGVLIVMVRGLNFREIGLSFREKIQNFTVKGLIFRL